MVRLGKFRTLVSEIAESPKIEKASFILPFFVIAVDIILIEHAIRINEPYIIAFTILLFFLSLVEIAVVIGEIHKHYQSSNFDRILTIKLDDFILERKKKNVKELVEDFVEVSPDYNSYRNEIYRIACQIMETHKEEAWEKALDYKLKKFMKRKKRLSVDGMLAAFLKRYPTYKKYRGEVYQRICKTMGIDKK